MDKKSLLNKDNKIFVLTLLSVVAVLVIVMALVPSNTSSISTNSADTIKYKAVVCTSLERANGEKEVLGCSHNLLYDTGKDMVKIGLGQGTLGAVNNISLCNQTAGCGTPVAGAGEAFTAYTNCGLNSQGGTYTSAGTGAWNIVKTFTSTCDAVSTNSTRLTNSTGGNFAGNTFTSVVLQSADQLTINWSITVS